MLNFTLEFNDFIPGQNSGMSLESILMIEEFDYIAKLPGLAKIKDVDSKFITYTQDFAKLDGWKSSDEAYGKSEYEVPADVENLAGRVIELDKIVINSGVKMTTIDIQYFSTGWKVVLAERNLIKNEDGKIIGIFSPLIDLSHVEKFKFFLELSQYDTKKLRGSSAASYIMTDSHCPLSLSQRQEECLFLLVRRKSKNEIARILSITPRTVEDHLDAIKIKLDCKYASDVIEYAIEKGFIFYIPKRFQTPI